MKRLPDYYAVLGVAPGADKQTIRSAYLQRAKALHPDVDGGDGSLMQDLNEAYAVLSDTVRRREFDLSLQPQPSAGQRLDLIRGARFSCSSALPSMPCEHAVGSGWQAREPASQWLCVHFSVPVWLERFYADAVPIPYTVKRNNMDFVEIHRLVGLEQDMVKPIREIRLLTAGDRDLALVLEQPFGPVSALRLESIRSPQPPGWKNMRIYGLRNSPTPQGA